MKTPRVHQSYNHRDYADMQHNEKRVRCYISLIYWNFSLYSKPVKNLPRYLRNTLKTVRIKWIRSKIMTISVAHGN